ncbi:hypothetical protein JD969_14260 [Planctomycetota bacterium]|nr:hypothetical protein JD969_14260 [Planctomycetota bacterium]
MDIKLSLRLLIIHTIIVLTFAAIIFKNYDPSPQAPNEIFLLWNIILIIDLPSSFIFMLLDANLITTSNTSTIIKFITFPATTFLICGGIQYYLLGKFISFIYHKFKNSKSQPLKTTNS